MKKLLLFVPALSLLAQSCVPLQKHADTPSTTDRFTGSSLPNLSLTPELIYKVLLADVAQKRGHLEVAKKEYHELAEKTRDPRLIERAARVAFIARDNELALKNARLWVDVDPENLEARKLLSVLLIKTHNTSEAVEHLEKLVSDYWSNNVQGFTLIARLLGNEKDPKIAYEVMKKLVERHPDVPEAHFALADLAVRADDFKAANESIDKVLALKPGWQEAIIFRSRVLQMQGEVPEALAYLAKEVENKPENLSLRLSYAKLLLEAKRHRDARDQFKVLAEQAPDNEDILYTLGVLSLEVKQYDDAELYLKRLYDMDKKTLAAGYFIGQVKERKKEFDQAIDWYGKVDRGQYYLSAQIRIAMLYARQGEVQKARDYLDTIEVHNKEQRVQVFLARGEIYKETNEKQKEYEAYSEALEEYPDETKLLYARALAAESVDKLDVVEQDLRKILKGEPDNAAALNALGYTLADRTTRYDEAFELIKRAYELQPDDPAIMDSMGWVHYRLQKYQEAEKYLRMAIEESDDPEIAAHLGEVLWVQGNETAAKQVWEKARTAAPDSKILLDVMQKYEQL